MIRVAAIAGGFLAVTLTLILVQKDNQPRPVARLEPSKASPSVRQDRDTVNHPEPARATQEEQDQHVSRNDGGMPLDRTVVKAQSAPPSYTKGTARPVISHSETDLENLIAGAMQQGQSPAYIAALVKQTSTGGGPIPAPRLVHNGALDIASLVGALTAPEPTAKAVSNRVTYTVQAGDTLAAISYRFYGNTAHGSQIISANPDSFENQTGLAIGQRLVIPTL